MDASTSASGRNWRSDGKLLTRSNWRANNLVDHLAKQAAAIAAPPQHVIRSSKAGKAAVRHAATKLRIVTHAANNHLVRIDVPGGTTKTVVQRDATGPGIPKRAPKKTDKPTLPMQRNSMEKRNAVRKGLTRGGGQALVVKTTRIFN